MPPAAVVGHADQLLAAILDGDRNPRRLRIDGVVDQLLDDAGRTFYDFARGDLVDQQIGKDADSAFQAHGIPVACG